MKDEITTYFEGNYLAFYERYLPQIKKERGNQHKAKCPFHDDKEPSLSINSSTGQFNCFGCDRKGDIFNFYAEQHNLDIRLDFPKILTSIANDFGIEEKHNKMNIVKTYDYTDAEGQLLYQQVRIEPKDFRVRRPNGNGDWIWDLNGVQRVLYHLPAVLEADEVLICEGEKDADNVTALGLTATTCPLGAKKWKDEYNEPLKGKDIVLIPDNDPEGLEHMARVATSLDGGPKSIKLIELPGLSGKQDVSDFIAKFDDPLEATEKLCTIIEGTALYEPPNHLTEEDVLQGLNNNEDGDAELFIKLNHRRFVYDHLKREWYYFGKHYWIQDTTDKAMAALLKVIQEYSWLIEVQSKKRLKAEKGGKTDSAKRYKDSIEALYKRISVLQNLHRKTDVLTLAGIDWSDHERQSLAITGQQWDPKRMVLPCVNGILDLQLGANPILQAGSPEDYIKTTCPIRWKGINEPATKWEKFLLEIFDGDEALVNYAQELFGYALTGTVKEHILLILFGAGRNGKGTLIQVLTHVLGALVTSIGVETLLAHKYPRQAGSASPHIMALKGRKIVWTCESAEGRRFDTGMVKLLTGGEDLSGRPPYAKDEVNFKQTHTLFFLTNNRPNLPADDYAIWKRVHSIPFKRKFIDDPQEPGEYQKNPNMLEELIKEAPGILAWLVRGCHRWQENRGLKIPDGVKKSTSEYRKEVDTIGHFLDACCEINKTDYEMKGRAGILHDAYMEWCRKNGYRYDNVRAFGKNMKEKFRKEKDEYGIYYEGVKLLVSSVEIEEKNENDGNS